MSEILQKLSTYNIFNYLLPGVLFAAFGTQITKMNLLWEDLFVGTFVYYFYGMVISRIGSLFVEKFLKSAGALKFAPYADYLQAIKHDQQIITLSEQNNVYRTLSGLFVALFLLKLLDMFQENLGIHFPDWMLLLFVLTLLGLFIFAYIKQTDFVRTRIEQNSLGPPNDE